MHISLEHKTYLYADLKCIQHTYAYVCSVSTFYRDYNFNMVILYNMCRHSQHKIIYVSGLIDTYIHKNVNMCIHANITQLSTHIVWGYNMLVKAHNYI